MAATIVSGTATQTMIHNFFFISSILLISYNKQLPLLLPETVPQEMLLYLVFP
jgi:hypothetical protein